MMKFIRNLFRPSESRGAPAGFNWSNGGGLINPTVAGLTITPQVALTFTAVYAAINVISRDFASLPPAVYKRRRDQGKRLVIGHPVQARLSREPDPTNPGSTALRFRQALMGHILGWGNGYAEIVRSADGNVEALKLLNPAKMRPKVTASGKLFYVEGQGETERKHLAENVFHMAGLGFDGVTGYSPITLAREAIGLGKAAEQFGSSLFGNGAIPKGILKTTHKLKPDAVENLRQSWTGYHGGSQNANRTAILENGLDWVNTQINPDDAQFLLTRGFQVLEIARVFCLPPHKIGDYSQSHLANVEESNLDYVSMTIAGWVAAFEAEANLKLLSEDESNAGLFISCDMTALMRGNMTARVTYYSKMFGLGAINSDEIRLRENLNPIGAKAGGEKFMVPANLTTLEKAGEAPLVDPTNVPAPDKSAPDDTGDGSL